MDETLKIAVSPKGRVSVEVIGGRGESCLDATRAIEEALGDVVERRKKPEFYQVTTNAQQNVKRG